MSQVIRFDYDDQILDVIDKVNAALKKHNLELAVKDEEAYYDGYEIYELRKTNDGRSDVHGPGSSDQS